MAIIRKPEKLFKNENGIKKHNVLVNIAERLMSTKTIKKKYIYYSRSSWKAIPDRIFPMEKRLTDIGNIWFVTTEPKTIRSTYIPDVISWYYQQSIVFECKTSRADFLNDKKKRNKIGVFFYYVAPQGIIKPNDLRTEGLFEVPEDFAERKIRLNEIKSTKPCVQLLNYKDINYAEEMNCLFYILRH